MTIRKTYCKLLLILCIGMGFSANGQIHNYEYLKDVEYSNYVNNTALVLSDSLKKLLFVEITPEFKQGNLNNIKEPKGYNKYSIFTKGVKKFNNLIFNGILKYSKIKELDRKYCNVYNYNTRFPYYPFDTIAGNWNKNDLYLSAGITKPYLLKSFTVGFNVSYGLTTGAKQTDPRPLTRNNEIILSPSMLFHINRRNWVGFNLKVKKGKETTAQNFFNTHSTDKVFSLTGLGALTVSGYSKRYFTKNSLRPEILFIRKNKNSKLMCVLFYDLKSISTNIKWRDKPKAETNINKYNTSEIGGSFLFDKKKHTFAHLIKLNTSYISGSGESIISMGTTEHSGLIYENDDLMPYHSDNSLDANLMYSIFRLNKTHINYKVSSNLTFNSTEINYSGGTNNLLSISAIKGMLFYEKSILSLNKLSLSLNAQANYYYPINSILTMKTTFTSSKFAEKEFNYLTNKIIGYKLGISCLGTINQKSYNLQLSYANEFLKGSLSDNRQFFNIKLTTYF